MKELFLDANAHVPLNPKALKAYVDFCSSKASHGHPSSLSEPGRAAATAMETAREKIAELIGAKSLNQIVFTSSCTQACEWAIQMLFDVELENNNTICSPVEHPAIKDAYEKHWPFHGKPDYLNISTHGELDISNLDSYFKIICTHMQNEIGTIQPLEKFKSKLVCSDMSQSLGKFPVNVTDLDVDLAVFGAHKFGGPGGVGFIYMKDTSWWRPFGTGSRYFMDRPGTPDVAGIVATAAALEDALQTLPERHAKMVLFKNTLEMKLKNSAIEIIGEGAHRSSNTTFIYVPKIAMNAVLTLGQKGIHVGLGSACGSMHAGPSPLMKVLGRQGSVHDYMRISHFGEYDDKDADHFFSALKSII